MGPRADRCDLHQLRERAFESLVEMARWKGLGHAMPARAMLGRMAGLSDEEIRKAFETGARDEVIARMVRLIQASEGNGYKHHETIARDPVPVRHAGDPSDDTCS